MVMLSRIFDLHTSFRVSRSKLENSMTRITSSDRFAAIEDAPPYAELGISERLRFNIRAGEQSRIGIQNGMSFIDQADAYGDTIINIVQRMMEITAVSLNSMLQDDERRPLEAEYHELKEEITSITRHARFLNKQTVGRDAVMTYDSVNEQMRFYQADGGDPGEIVREFGAEALDANQNFIGYNSDRDFSMSRDARSMFYIGETASGSGSYTVNRYDIGAEVSDASSDSYNATDKMHVDEQAQLFVSNGNALYFIDKSSLARTATGITDIAAGTEFSVYKDEVTYFNTADEVVTYDLATSTQTATLIADTTTVVAGQAGVFAAGGVDHAVSSSGEYIADEVSAGVIRIMNTRNGTGSFVNIGTANAVTDIQFSEDSDRVYFLDKDANEVRYVNFATEQGGVDVVIGGPKTIAKGDNQLRFDGLSTGGANNDSITSFVLKQDSISVMDYEAGDFRQYQLGLLNTRIDTILNAESTMQNLIEAHNRTTTERAKLGATGARLRHTLDSHLQYIADTRNAESLIRDTDIAKETSLLSQLQVRNAVSMKMINRYNSLSESVLQLLNR